MQKRVRVIRINVMIMMTMIMTMTMTMIAMISLVTEEVSFNRPTLLSSHSRLQNQRTILTPKVIIDMIITVIITVIPKSWNDHHCHHHHCGQPTWSTQDDNPCPSLSTSEPSSDPSLGQLPEEKNNRIKRHLKIICIKIKKIYCFKWSLRFITIIMARWRILWYY